MQRELSIKSQIPPTTLLSYMMSTMEYILEYLHRLGGCCTITACEDQ